jgi:hypothetical protein
MKLASCFDIGQKVWAIVNDGRAVKELTVGQVQVTYVDSPGREGETMFNNYMPQQDYKEQYMCVETGIGSGSVFTLGKNIFTTEELAWAKLAED